MNQIAAPDTYHASASRVWLALGAVYLIWGSTYLAIRFTVETIPPLISAAARFIFSGAFLVFFRRLAGDAMPSSVQWRNAAIIGIFLLVCGNGGVVWAAQFIPSSLSALLVATVPLWMVLLDAIRPGGSSPGVRPLCGILLGFTGALLLIGLTRDGASSENFYGALVVLAASLFWAVGSVYGKTAVLPASPLLTTGIEMLAGGTVQALVALMTGEFDRFSFVMLSERSVLAWVYLTIIGTLAFVAYGWLLRAAPLPLVATYSYVNPLVAIILCHLLGKEVITARVLLAAGLIVGSVALVSRRRT